MKASPDYFVFDTSRAILVARAALAWWELQVAAGWETETEVIEKRKDLDELLGLGQAAAVKVSDIEATREIARHAWEITASFAYRSGKGVSPNATALSLLMQDAAAEATPYGSTEHGARWRVREAWYMFELLAVDEVPRGTKHNIAAAARLMSALQEEAQVLAWLS